MKEGQDIEKLFRDKLTNHQSAVDPKIWNVVSAKIGATSAVGGSAAGGIFGMSKLASTIIIGALSIGGAVGVYYGLQNDEKPSSISKTEIVEESVKPKGVENTTVINNIAEEDESSEVITEEATQETAISDKGQESDMIRTPLQLETSQNIPNQVETTPSENNVNGANSEEGKTEGEELTNKSNETTPKEPVNPIVPTTLDVEISITEGAAPLKTRVSVETNRPNPIITIVGKEKTISSTSGKEVVLETPGDYVVTVTIEGEDIKSESLITVYPSAELKLKEGLVDPFEGYIVLTPQGLSNQQIEFENLRDVEVGSYSLVIFDHETKDVVFTSQNPEEGWPCVDNNGNAVEAGIYYCLITVVDKSGNSQKPIKKTVYVRR